MPTDAELRAARDATITLPRFPPYRVLNRMAYKDKGAVALFRWCVVDAREQICFVGDVRDRATADARVAALNGKEQQ